MPKITVDSKKQYPDLIYAASLFIDDITGGDGIFVKLFYENGDVEDQIITSGSKFLTRGGSRIKRVLFINPSATQCDIEYHYSTLSSYDEAKVIGDVNAVTKPYNKSLDNNVYKGGYLLGSSAGNYGRIALINKNSGSGKSLWVDGITVSSTGSSANLARNQNLIGLLNWTVLSSFLHSTRDGGANGEGEIHAVANAIAAVNDITLLPTATNQSLSSFDYTSCPIEVLPGGNLLVSTNSWAANLKVGYSWSEY